MILPDSWHPSGNLVLEPNAGRTVRSQRGCIALLAGPGAGKTETLAQRADFLLRTGVCRYPKRILAISIKKDASENLKDRVSRRCGAELATRFDSYTFHAFAKLLIDIFRTSLNGTDKLNEDYTIGEHRFSLTQITFNDMVPIANGILDGCPEALKSIQSTYSDVFLDEFQDCTKVQYSMIKRAFGNSGARMIAVGDTKQMIMGWAGALKGIFLSYRNDFDAIPLNLYQNFRSLHRIRRVQNRMVRDIDPPAAIRDELIDKDEGEVDCKNFDTDEAEASWIADSIERWHQEGIPYSQIAILCNTQPHLYAKKIMEELISRIVPYRNEQAVQDLFAEPLCCLVTDYLLVLLGEAEADAWDRLRRFLDQDSSRFDARARDWDRFIQVHSGTIRETPNPDTAWLVIEEMLEKLGVDSIRSLSHDYENAIRYSELLVEIRAHVVESFAGTTTPIEGLKSMAESEAVRILTIHKCKGLEFHTVIVHGVETETFFGQKVANECSFFVAISRAKARLVSTVVGYREKLPGANHRWSENRSRHEQFLGYVEPEASLNSSDN